MTDEEIRDRLKRKQMKVLSHVKHKKGEYPYDTYTVIYLDAGKAKIGTISSPYYYLHGPNVLATHNGHRAWFQSSRIVDEMKDDWVDMMAHAATGGSLTNIFPDLNVSKIEILR
jgi:hypothetical protein